MKSADQKRPLKVFLCHASTDKPKVRELYRYLKRRGINPWFDEEHLVGGQDWQVEIPKALATSDAIIICLTKNSIDKEGYIQKEIKFALDKALEMPEGRIFLIPVKFDECEVPFTLSRYQWVDLTVESGYAKMMKALKFRASQLERSTVEIPQKAIDKKKLFFEEILYKEQDHISVDKSVQEEIVKSVSKNNKNDVSEKEGIVLDAVSLFSIGKINEAINKLEVAYEITRLPEYKELKEKYQQFNSDYKDISDTFFMAASSPDAIIRVSKKLDILSSEHFKHPMIRILRNRLGVIISGLAEILRQEIKDLMTQAERATTIDLAQVFAQQAKLKADQVIELGIQDLSLKKLSNELKDLLAKLSQMEDTLIKAEDAYLRHKSWPVEAWTISKELRERFPSDPKVIGVANQLSDFKVNRTTLRFAFFLIVVMFLVFMANLGVNSYNLYILALTPTATSIIELNSTPSAFYTIDAVSSPTVEFSKNITTLPDEITDAKGVEMVLVPAGEFTMGSDYSENEEHPRHQVYLDDFYMDTYEVTNKLYRNCVDDYACTPPEDVSSKNRNNYFDNPEFNEFPVVYVNWEQAKTYCEWRGGHLPTEAQWEKAARGTDERIYPWGDNISCDYANYYNGTKYCVLETTKVGSYDRGKSIYGIYDLAGNVWEWVADRYDEKYYQNSPFENPSGPENGEERVFRGGAWDNHENLLYTFVRNKSKPLDSYSGLGFRCAKSANP